MEEVIKIGEEVAGYSTVLPESKYTTIAWHLRL